MGVILRAHDSLRGHDVAFKRLSIQQEHLRAQVTALFEREFHTLVQLAHPGIVEAYDYGIDDLGPYYTMELLAGRDLRVGMPLPVEPACRLLYEIASALALVHARRLVHRDLSPANVLLTITGHAKLIDFGALASFGRPRQIVGTPAYMAPECLSEQDIDQRADLYSLGALAYWILTGVRAVRAESLRDLMTEAWTREIPPPSHFVPELPQALDELVLSLLQYDPLARPASAAYVIDRLSSIANLPLEEDVQRVAASYVAYPPLVGRTDELRLLEHLMRESALGRGHAVWVEAAQGVGRSALLDQLALQAQLSGATVLRVRAGSQGGALSLGKVLVGSALRTHPDLRSFYAQLNPNMTAFCLNDAGDDRTLPQAMQTPAAAAECYAELLSGMQHCLLELSRLNPLVITIDDVHRADAESLGLLASLAHAARENSLLLLTSAASEELNCGTPGLAKLSQIARHVWLSTLQEGSIAALVTAIFGAVPNATRLARWLYAQSEGNPQRAVDLLRLLLQRGLVRYRGGLFSLPYDVSTQLDTSDLGRVPLWRLEALGAPARSVAQLLSIEEEALGLDVLSAALDLEGARFFGAVAELLERGIARKADGCLELSSRPLRSAAESTLTPALRCALHLRLARTILAHECSVERRIMAGFHLLKGGLRDQGADTLSAAAMEISYRAEGIAKAVPALEQALEVYQAQGRSDLACVRLLVPLTVAGFYGDPRLSVRYLERTYRALLSISGTTLAARLGPFLGAKLALLLGLAYSYVRFLCTPRALRMPHFRQVLSALFAVASAGTAAMTSAYEQDRTLGIIARLAPFAALGVNSGASAVRELCRGLAEIMLSAQADCAARMRHLAERLSGPGKLIGLDDEIREQMLLGAVYVQGVSEVYAGNPVVLELAAQLEASGRAFARPRAALLRMCHYGFRGEQALAEEQRGTVEVLALLGGTSWSAMSAAAIRQLLTYQWTRDSVGLLRVVSELENLAVIAPALDTHRELAQAFLELLRGRPARALAVYERVLDAPRTHPVVNWQSEAAYRAQALNALGRPAEARQVCLAVIQETRDIDRRMRFLYQPALQELAISEALLGHVSEAGARLEALLDELAVLDNALLRGAVHRDRGRVALLAGDAAGFELHLRKMNDYFRATQNPCLVQQCEQLAMQGANVGLRVLAASVPSAVVRRPVPTGARGTGATTVVDNGHLATTVAGKLSG
jgi:tetratricopeptide (TPR) repeat protein